MMANNKEFLKANPAVSETIIEEDPKLKRINIYINMVDLEKGQMVTHCRGNSYYYILLFINFS